MILTFDLDDTLYDESSFVKSGFRAVSEYLYKNYSISTSTSFRFMENRLDTYGRRYVFDALLSKYGLKTRENVRKCVSIYRSHKPKIRLYPEAHECLKRFQSFPIYIVTDGNKLVQRNKALSLGLYERIKFCYLTSCYGLRNSKPSPYCFSKICERENVSSQKVVCVGDDPNKDFVGIKPLGFKTIRVLTGRFKDVKKNKSFEADYHINSLKELTFNFLHDVLTI